MTQILIRPATIVDLKTIVSLNHDLFAYEHQFNPTYNLDWPHSPSGRDYFQNRLTQDNAICLIAQQNHKVIGYLVGFIDTYSFRSHNPILEIENMLVIDTQRRQTIGTKLIQELKAWAKSKQVKRLKVQSLIHNTPAIKFYRKNNFAKSHIILEQEI